MVAVMWLLVGPDPGILPGSGPFELYLASWCVPVRDVGVEVGFEALEGLPVLAVIVACLPGSCVDLSV